MIPNLKMILLIAAVILVFLGAIGVNTNRVNLAWLGVDLFILTFLL